MEEKPKYCRKEGIQWKICREGDCVKGCGFNCTEPTAFSFDPEWFVEAGKIQITVMCEGKNEDAIKAMINGMNFQKIIRLELKRECRSIGGFSDNDIGGVHCKTSSNQ